MMKRLTLLLVLLLSSTAWAHGTGRWCSNGYCGMCNRLHLQYGHATAVPGLSYQKYVNVHRGLHNPPIESTPQVVVGEMLVVARLTTDDLLYDLGCGDGRIVIAAARDYGCRAVGIELNPIVAAIAQTNVEKAGQSDLVKIIVADARKCDLSRATVVTMYLFPDLMVELEPKLIGVTRIVSYSHEIPNRRNEKLLVGGRYPTYEQYPIYLWSSVGVSWTRI